MSGREQELEHHLAGTGDLCDALRKGHALEYLDTHSGPDSALQLLSDGASLARVHRVRLHAGDAVLKMMPLDAPGDRLESARREIRFYQEVASHVSVGVPELLWARDGPEATVLLLTWYPPMPPSTEWSDEIFVDVARSLARFHARFWTGAEARNRWPWLREPESLFDERRIDGALAAWVHLSRIPRLQNAVTRHRLCVIEMVARRYDPLYDTNSVLPVTLVHGDFHAANLLAGPNHTVLWADWQEVGIGPGTDDITHLVGRARGDGAAVPDDKLLEAYHEEVAQSLSVDAGALRNAVEAGELLKIVLDWPHYLAQSPAARVVSILDRMEFLVERAPWSW
jgi:Ser/Thr protein kinase RdoA (MazF antagonist)